DLVPNHLISARLAELPPEAREPELAGRALLVERLEMLPVERVVRGYLAGSGCRDYRETGAIRGHPLPPGLRQAERLPEPTFPPATKAAEGHDENITIAEAAAIVGPSRVDELERLSKLVYA